MTIDKSQLLAIVSANGDRRERQIESEKYYRGENTFIDAVKKSIALQVEESVRLIENPYTSNYKEVSGYYKVLVDQAVSYSVNAKMQCDVEGTDIEKIMGKKWRSTLRRIAKDARLKGFGVAQFYIENNTTKMKSIPAEQCIPCYDDDGERLTAMIRMYDINRNGDLVGVMEYWDSDTVTRYEMASGEEWVCVVDAEPHLSLVTAYGASVTDAEKAPWGVVPFAVLKNNDEFLPDIKAIKSKIDAYDVVSSDYINDLVNHGSPYFVLKNLSGTTQEDWDKFKANFVKSKVIKVDDDGGVDLKTLDIPHEARTTKLEQLEREIFLFGMGVNVASMKGNITATEIMAGYDNLNLKAQEFESGIVDFLDDVVQFLRYGASVTPDLLNVAPCECTFVHPMVFDENKKIELIIQSKGHLSRQTMLELDPRVPDADEEAERLEDDMDAMIEKYTPVGGAIPVEEELGETE